MCACCIKSSARKRVQDLGAAWAWTLHKAVPFNMEFTTQLTGLTLTMAFIIQLAGFSSKMRAINMLAMDLTRIWLVHSSRTWLQAHQSLARTANSIPVATIQKSLHKHRSDDSSFESCLSAPCSSCHDRLHTWVPFKGVLHSCIVWGKVRA